MGDLAGQLAQAATGLQSKDEYRRKREALESGSSALSAAANGGAGGGARAEEGGKKKKKKKAASSVLSFGDELEAEETSPRLEGSSMAAMRERKADETARAEEAAMREFLLAQEKAKAEPVTLSYTFRSEVTQRELSSTMHQGTLAVLKGATAEEVTKRVRAEVELLGEKFKLPEVSGVKDLHRELMLIVGAGGQKFGSFVVPPHMNLVELLAAQWTEGTPLFDGFKCGVQVTERRWYEAMKHTYPYSQWTVYDVKASYSHKEFVANRNKGEGVADPVRPPPRDVTKQMSRPNL